MNKLIKQRVIEDIIRKMIIWILILFLNSSVAFAHGPKGHEGNEFTALQAAKKSVALSDRLVASGKLSEAWETDMKQIEIFSRQVDKGNEIVVKFNRSKGEPRSVYIFFTEKGEYFGSNFTGD